jgi:hypothetical protein
MSEQTIAPVALAAVGPVRPRVASLVSGTIVCLFAVVFLAGGSWALWKDRVDRDASGFVSIGTASLRTETYAIVGDLHGYGPSWWWESDVLGDSRVRATSDVQKPLFVGIARTDDLLSYLRGVGYATIDSFEVTPDTTHAGWPPSGPPSRESIWATSAQGTGQQALGWDSRAGDWSIVFMNADAGSGVAVRGDASAELPILPWIAVGLLVLGAASACIGGWLVVRGIRGHHQRPSSEPARSQQASASVPVAAQTSEEVQA